MLKYMYANLMYVFQYFQICHKHKGLFLHSDIAQMAGKVPIDVEDLGLDLASISGHKVILQQYTYLILLLTTYEQVYGPKGIGALYVRRRPRVRLEPIISGGGQERGLRSGTLAPALCVGLGEAARICKVEMENDLKWIDYLSNKMKR